MEGHQHVDCGKVQLGDVLLSCLNVFFILNGGFLLHRSDVSRRALETGEVPGACFKPQVHRLALVKSSWCKLPGCTVEEHLCLSHPIRAQLLHLQDTIYPGHKQDWCLEKHKNPCSFSELSLPTCLALGIYLCTYILCWTGSRGRRVVPGAESNLPEGFLRHLQDLPGVSLEKKTSFTYADSKPLIQSHQKTTDSAIKNSVSWCCNCLLLCIFISAPWPLGRAHPGVSRLSRCKVIKAYAKGSAESTHAV